jgi:hypothetical protein
MRSVERYGAWAFAAVVVAGVASGSGAALARDRGAPDSYKVVFARSTIPLAGGGTQTLLSADVSEAFVIDTLGRPALDACTRELTDGWDSCLCRRTGWESIQVQREGTGFTYHLMRWDGAAGEPTPTSWNVGRTGGTPHGLETKVVPFE